MGCLRGLSLCVGGAVMAVVVGMASWRGCRRAVRSQKLRRLALTG